MRVFNVVDVEDLVTKDDVVDLAVIGVMGVSVVKVGVVDAVVVLGVVEVVLDLVVQWWMWMW